jgi:dTDP-3-amino-3,4,6-trideoxy-alpha-D-glucose transaminase
MLHRQAGAAEAVPFVDLARVHTDLREDLRDAFDRVVGASSFTLGAEVEGFEEEFAAFCGTAQCVGVASGTAAITLILLAAGIGRGDEVIVPAHTYIASALGVLHAGATPIFCDVDGSTGLMDPAAAASAVSPRTAALLPVHLYGQACDMVSLGGVAERHGLAVFEDAAQAHGATLGDRRAGSLAAAAAFSFYPSKNLGALGDGGAITTDDSALAARCRELRNIGQRTKGEHVVAGFNERLDGLQAALLRAKLPHLDSWNADRRRAAGEYRSRLDGTVGLLGERSDSPCVFHLYPVRVRDRAGIGERLEGAGIATGVHYSPAVHLQPPFQAIGAPPAGSFPAAEAWAREELSLPMFPGLRTDEIERISRECQEAVIQPEFIPSSLAGGRAAG